MKLINFICVLFVSFTLHSQDSSLYSLFFNTPIFETRDSIIDFCYKNASFSEIKSEYKTYKFGIEIKTFYGNVNISSDSLEKFNISKAEISVSTGVQKFDNDSIYKTIIPIHAYYHFKNKKSANLFFSESSKIISTFTNKEITSGKVYEDDRLIGYAKLWNHFDYRISSIELEYVKIRFRNSYKVTINIVLLIDNYQ